MRTKNKITREQHRVKKAQKQESKVLYFAQDPQVSSRILAVLHVGATKSAVPLYEKKQGTKDIFVYNKKTKKKEKKTITTSIHVFNGQAIKEIERFKVICGSNGKMGTWYNTISGVRDARAGVEVSEAQKFCRTRVVSWIDEIIEAEFASGKDPPKDPPEERKSKIKKLIRAVRENIRYSINSKCPIDLAFTWRNTKQGHECWRKIDDLVINELSK